jgi:hypothetical protein
MPDSSKGLFTRIISALPLVFSALALILSFLSFQLTSVRSIKPVLTIAYQSDMGWSLTNVGYGPALNVIVAQRESEGDWSNPVRVPPLALGATIRLEWLHHTNIKWLGASYTDTDGRQYSSMTAEDLTTIRTGNSFPRWREQDILKQWLVEGNR